MPRLVAWLTGTLLALVVPTAGLRSGEPGRPIIPFPATAENGPAASEVKDSRPPSFLNDVMPLFTRLGCNQGACHGKNAGQNGFRLSLRGYAPEWDYLSLTREFDGRRISTAVPEDSLLLQKPLGLAPHEGGKLFRQGGREYQVLLDWLKAGAPGPLKDDPEVRRLEVLPGKRA
jgi:hypothetical protein